MAGFKVIAFLIIVEIVNSTPLFKEVKIEKKFDFSFKPPEFKPITFMRQKWTHFGHFVTKHTIGKRSPFELAPIPVKLEEEPAPMFKVPLEKSFEAGSPVVTPVPPMFVPEKIPGLVTPVPAVSVPPLPVSLLPPMGPKSIEQVVIITPIPPPPPPIVSPPPVSVPTPILPPIPAPVPVPGPPPPEVPKPLVQGNLLTDIARVEEINAYLKAVEALSPPPVPPPIEENVLPVVSNSIEVEVAKPPVDEKVNQGPLVKGSRLALYFGNILLQVMSEVISSARSAISQYSQPAPF